MSVQLANRAGKQRDAPKDATALLDAGCAELCKGELRRIPLTGSTTRRERTRERYIRASRSSGTPPLFWAQKRMAERFVFRWIRNGLCSQQLEPLGGTLGQQRAESQRGWGVWCFGT
jgi:hypothetical protein